MKLTLQGTGLDVRVGLSSGVATVAMTRDGAPIASTDVPGKAIGELAVSLLAVARSAQEMAGLPAAVRRPGDEVLEGLPSKVSVGPSTRAGHKCISFTFGQSMLDIAVPDEQFGALARAMLALDVSDVRH